ncbi:MAG: helix-hairpin-helix domain-containing protein [Eubacterium sp.]|nr:helix-hairpin-helix domain-containing protein [Eubacterium sp.]
MENHQTEPQEEIKSDKYLTRVLIAVALIIIGIIFLVIALNQPKLSNDKSANSTWSVSDNSKTNYTEKSTTKKNSTTGKNQNSVSFPINLNTCSAEDLMAIEHVGETRANAIIAYRDFLGGYTSVEQLKNISGIGDSVYASIEPYVTV